VLQTADRTKFVKCYALIGVTQSAYLKTCPCRPWHSLCFRLAGIFASFTSSLHEKRTQHVAYNCA